MSRIVNKNKGELSFANDRECANRRRLLIRCGVISADNSGVVNRDDGSPAMSTKKASVALRAQLVKDGIIDPNYINIPPAPYKKPLRNEEGEYNVRPIKTQAQYERRRVLYFRMLQEILISRRELNLNLGPKQSSDPDWIF